MILTVTFPSLCITYIAFPPVLPVLFPLCFLNRESKSNRSERQRSSNFQMLRRGSYFVQMLLVIHILIYAHVHAHISYVNSIKREVSTFLPLTGLYSSILRTNRKSTFIGSSMVTRSCFPMLIYLYQGWTYGKRLGRERTCSAYVITRRSGIFALSETGKGMTCVYAPEC